MEYSDYRIADFPPENPQSDNRYMEFDSPTANRYGDLSRIYVSLLEVTVYLPCSLYTLPGQAYLVHVNRTFN